MFTQDKNCLKWSEKYIFNRYYENIDWNKEDIVPCIFDIGHNSGDFTKEVFELTNKKIKVYAFEPNSNVVSQFANNTNVNISNFGISDINGKSILYVPTNNVDSNTYSVCSSLSIRPVFKNLVDIHIKEIEIELMTIDSFCEFNNVDYIDYLKIDTEGYEFEVIKGANKMFLKKLIACGQFEFGDTFKERGYSIEDVIQLLLHYDYECYLSSISDINILSPSNAYEKIKKYSNDLWENIIFVDRQLLRK